VLAFNGTVYAIHIYYEIALNVQIANKHVQNLTGTNTVYHSKRIGSSKKANVIKRDITITASLIGFDARQFRTLRRA